MSSSSSSLSSLPSAAAPATGTAALVLPIVLTVGLAHLINDLIQALLPAIYPMLKQGYGLTFTQVGLITLTFQITASLIQPWIGMYTDKHPKPFLLPLGAVFTLLGVLLLSRADGFYWFLLGAALIGIGSSTFHPEASRVARMASGGRFGFAQSTFQVGGNLGSALGPLLAAAVIVNRGQGNIAWFSLLAVLAIGVLYKVSHWYSGHLASFKPKAGGHGPNLSRNKVLQALGVLALLVFSKYIYMASLSSYYTFYLIDKFHLS